MKWEYTIRLGLTQDECKLLVTALDSFIRRIIRDYNHDVREGVSVERLQNRQARIEAAKELREKIDNEVEQWQDI